MTTLEYHPDGTRQSERESFAGIEQATQIGALIGYSVMWYMDGLNVEHDALVSLMRDPTIDLPDFIPDPPTPRVALHRALEAMLRTNKGLSTPDEDEGDVRKLLIRPINDYNKEFMAFAIIGESADLLEQALRYKTEWRVKFHKKSGAMICVDTPTGRIEDEQMNPALQVMLDPYWQQYRTYRTSRDLSMVIKSVIDWASAISLRKQGGVYFVPVERKDVLDRVRLLISHLTLSYGGEPVFLCLGVPDEVSTRRQMSVAAHHALISEAEELLAELSRVLNGDAKTRKSTFRERLAQYHYFHMKLEAYEEILIDRRGALTTRLAMLDELGQRLMLED